MTICTKNIAKAEIQPTSQSEIGGASDTSCLPYALSPHPELNEDFPEHLDDLAIMYGRHFGD